MTNTAVMNTMLGWLRSVASWVLDLFDLNGTSGFSPLEWLSRHWLPALIVLLVTGVVLDFIVWLIRWRPYWVWFGKKRIVIGDDDFFAGEEFYDSGLYDPGLMRPRTRRVAPRRSDETIRRRTDARKGTRERRQETDPIFRVRSSSRTYPDNREDEVFNVSDLPVTKDEKRYRRRQGRVNR